MVSKNYKHWISVEDDRRCAACEEKHGKIYAIDEIPNPKPPLHIHCKCVIIAMNTVVAGEATSKGKNGADWWLITYNKLPPYYISEGEARKLGWKSRKGNLSNVAPNRMLTKGVYKNRDGHLPTADGRIWYEADINYLSGKRNLERAVYSNDGLIFATYDHYNTFVEIVDNNTY